MTLIKIIRAAQGRKVAARRTCEPAVVLDKEVSQINTSEEVEVKKDDPNEIVPKLLQIGAWVAMGDKDDLFNLECGHHKYMRTSGMPAKIQYIAASDKSYLEPELPGFRASTISIASPIDGMGGGGGQFSCTSDRIKLISLNEAKRRINKARSKATEEVAKVYEKVKDKIEIPHVLIRSRKDYDIGDKLFLDTNMNYIALGSFKKDYTYNIGDFRIIAPARCCAVTKCTNDILVWIPKLWLQYCGYTKKDLELWLDFCTKTETGFEAKILGETTLDKVYGIDSPCTRPPLNTQGNYFIPTNAEVYEVGLKNGKANMITYLYFIMLRYIYNNRYFSIPFTAMQLKIALKDRATFWECLLVAQNVQPFDGYYALTNTLTSSVRFVLPTRSNSQNIILNKLRGGGQNMNNCFKYFTDGTLIAEVARSRAQIGKMIMDREYDQIAELIRVSRELTND